jgi:hypothetical protein
MGASELLLSLLSENQSKRVRFALKSGAPRLVQAGSSHGRTLKRKAVRKGLWRAQESDRLIMA